jgi:hypothetical protein
MKRSIAAICLVLSSACFTGPVPIGARAGVEYINANGRPVVAESCGFMLLALIPIATHNMLSRASQQLANRGRYVTDVQASTSWIYALVGTLHCVRLDAIEYEYRLRN